MTGDQALAKPEDLVFSDKEEQEIRAAFRDNPSQAMDMAIRGLRRLYLQGLEQKGRVLEAMKNAPKLSAQSVIDSRKASHGDLTPWSDSLAFAGAIQEATTQAWREKLATVLGVPEESR